jgi:hypothetical protein
VAQTNKPKKATEWTIENAVIENLGCLRAKYRGARVIRHMGIGQTSGTVDLVILPLDPNPHRLVLVEAKRHNSSQSAAEIVEQLKRYYVGATSFGGPGTKILKNYADIIGPYSREAPNRVSAQKACHSAKQEKLSRADAWARLCAVPKLAQKKVAIFLALDGKPKRRICELLDELYADDGPDVGIIVTDITGATPSVRAVGCPSDRDGLVGFEASLQDK